MTPTHTDIGEMLMDIYNCSLVNSSSEIIKYDISSQMFIGCLVVWRGENRAFHITVANYSRSLLSFNPSLRKMIARFFKKEVVFFNKKKLASIISKFMPMEKID